MVAVKTQVREAYDVAVEWVQEENDHKVAEDLARRLEEEERAQRLMEVTYNLLSKTIFVMFIRHAGRMISLLLAKIININIYSCLYIKLSKVYNNLSLFFCIILTV